LSIIVSALRNLRRRAEQLRQPLADELISMQALMARVVALL
jgi:hypothetical protein